MIGQLPKMSRVHGGYQMECQWCRQVWFVKPFVVWQNTRLGGSPAREEAVLAAIDPPGLAEEIRAHIAAHHGGELPWATPAVTEA